MKLTVTVKKDIEVEIDQTKLVKYAREARKRFGMPPDAGVFMADLLIQAGIDDDIDEIEDTIDDISGFDSRNPLSPQEINDLAKEED